MLFAAQFKLQTIGFLATLGDHGEVSDYNDSVSRQADAL